MNLFLLSITYTTTTRNSSRWYLHQTTPWTRTRTYHRGESPLTVLLLTGNALRAHGLAPIGHPREEILMVGPITTCWAYSSMHLVAPHVGHMCPILWSHILMKTHHLLMLSTAETPKLSHSQYIVILFQIKSALKRTPLITKCPRT